MWPLQRNPTAGLLLSTASYGWKLLKPDLSKRSAGAGAVLTQGQRWPETGSLLLEGTSDLSLGVGVSDIGIQA